MRATKVKITSKTAKATMENGAVLEMFQSMMGDSNGADNIHITYPKYIKIKEHALRFVKVLTALKDSSLITNNTPVSIVVNRYVSAMSEDYLVHFSIPDFVPFMPVNNESQLGIARPSTDYENIPPDFVSNFIETFPLAKKSLLVNSAIVACKNLVPHKKYIGNRDSLIDRFITKSSESTISPLPDLNINFKHLYIHDSSPEDKTLILLVLHKIYVVGHDLYEAISIPEADVEQFASVVLSSIEDVKKHIPRCDAAFNKLVDSIDILKNNFGSYYKDYTSSGNSSIIMENFVLDVAKNSNASPKVAAQFKRIVAHYRKISANSAHDPKIAKLLKHVDANFKELEDHMKSQGSAVDGEDGDDEYSESSSIESGDDHGENMDNK